MKRVLGAAAAVLAVAVLGGCSGPGVDSSADSMGAVAPDAVAPEGGPAAPADADRQVVTTGTASLVVEDPADGAQRVSELVEEAGGRVDERTEQTAVEQDGFVQGAAADLVVRVPADALTGFLADLGDVGEVTAVSVSDSDVTSTAVDLEARISALQTSTARLQTLLDGAATTGDLLEAESALSERQQELESLQSQRALLADQVDLSTLSVHLASDEVAADAGPDGFLEGLGTGWRALVTTLGAVVVVLGVLLPWLVVAGLVTAVVLLVVRRRRARARADAAAYLPPAAPPLPADEDAVSVATDR